MPGMNCDLRFNTQVVVLILFSYVLFSSCSAPYWSRMFGDAQPHGSWRFISGFRRYWVSLKWFSIPASVGFAYICYQQYGHIKKRENRKIASGDPEDLIANQWQVALYRKFPMRAVSRLWGQVNNYDLPVFMRWPVIGLYSWVFSCNLAEAEIEDIKSYPNLGAFFRRQLKPDVRPVDHSAVLTSPADGYIMHHGEVVGDTVEQVKGITYDLTTFLGPNHPCSKTAITEHSSEDKRHFFHCVLYLGPGDYHSFHSPAEWTVKTRRHFPGELLSVSPSIQRIIKGLFNYNERVVLSGSWEYGFFAYAAIGASNVGSIYVDFDEELKTNISGKYIPGSFIEKLLSTTGMEGFSLTKGQKMGGFNLGSTIVLIFEAPKDFRFNVKAGDKVKFGQALGTVGNKNE
ncbi:phosphatidylserine decarboxylase proenzyme, mitochondrial-like isoform X2 [Actinia tenebrosa]|uniref:Phosphatidylserine decarboxylase proenzyme, mitochondrial n=1 Tax=Actinia tenebrosa TaxID=6105 RepID=A0A6P8HLR7_ACTTE|nr:phosphatidylserine decarboxylase proenzyme, mitochondrial-like isoform X2 [Actinia tenebrosa]